MESRITPSEEVSLGEKTQEAMHLRKMRDDLEASLGREPTDEEWAASAGKLNLVALDGIMAEGLRAKVRSCEDEAQRGAKRRAGSTTFTRVTILEAFY